VIVDASFPMPNGSIALADPSPVTIGTECTLVATVAGNVDRVDFYGNSAPVESVLSAPWHCQWTARELGRVTLSARAFVGAVEIDVSTAVIEVQAAT
jgi:hypothetical protein